MLVLRLFKNLIMIALSNFALHQCLASLQAIIGRMALNLKGRKVSCLTILDTSPLKQEQIFKIGFQSGLFQPAFQMWTSGRFNSGHFFVSRLFLVSTYCI